jgi:uncharacterized protein YodC (DUF2158 family)
MEDKVKDGGPAFPIEMTATPYAPGMSLRDWFAGQALAGGMAAIGQDSGPVRWDAFAADCYRAADAMLAARGGRDE